MTTEKRMGIEFRKNVLKEFIRNLERARGQFLEALKQSESENDGMSFQEKLENIPKLQLEAPWGDALDVILDGLKRVADGDEDPFGLKPPIGGVLRVSDLDRFDMAVDAFRMWKTGGKSKDAALAETAEKYSFEGSEISPSTVRDALKKWEELLGDRLLDDKYCAQQRDLIDIINRAETTPYRSALR